MHPKMNGYSKSFDETKYISFLIMDNELLQKYKKSGIKAATILKRI